MYRLFLLALIVLFSINLDLFSDEITLIRTFVNGNNEANSEKEVFDLHIEYTREVLGANILTKGVEATATINNGNRKQVDIVFKSALPPGSSVAVAVKSSDKKVDVKEWWWTDGDGGKVVKEIKYMKGRKEKIEKKDTYSSRERGDETKEDLADNAKVKDHPYNITNKAHHWGGSSRQSEKITITMDIRKFVKDRPKELDSALLVKNIQMAIKQLTNCTLINSMSEVPKAGTGDNPENDGDGKDPAIMAPGPSHKGGKGKIFRSITDRECDALFFKYPFGLEIKLITDEDDKTKPDITCKWGSDPRWPDAIGVGPTNADSKEKDKTVSGEVILKKKDYHLANDVDGDGYITNKDGECPEKLYDFYSLFKHECGHVCCFNHSGERNCFVDDHADHAEAEEISPSGTDESNYRSVSPLDGTDNEFDENQSFIFSSDMLDGFGGYDLYFGYFIDGVFITENLGPGINSPANELDGTITGDGGSIVFSSDRDLTMGFDIFISNFDPIEQIWSESEKLSEEINSAFDERHPSFRSDMLTMYLASNRPGGFGEFDIYRSEFVPSVGWTAPSNIGEIINSEYSELSPSISPFGSSMYFTSDRPGGLGKFDIWSTFNYDGWATPVNAGMMVNSESDELEVATGLDFQTIFFSSDKGHAGLFSAYSSAIIHPRPNDIIEYFGLSLIAPINQKYYIPMMLDNQTGTDIYGFLAAVEEDGKLSETSVISQLDLISVINSTFSDGVEQPPTGEANAMSLIIDEEDKISNDTYFVVNGRIENKIPTSSEKLFIVSALNMNGNQILPDQLNGEITTYAMYKGFSGLTGANSAEFIGSNESMMRIKGLWFNIETPGVSITNAGSNLPHLFEIEKSYLQFDDFIEVGENFDFFFTIDDLGEMDNENYVLLTMRIDTGIASFVETYNSNSGDIINNISVSPNPSSSEFTISWESNESAYTTIYLTDLVGTNIGYLMSDEFIDLGQQRMFINSDNFNLSDGIFLLHIQLRTSEKIEMKVSKLILIK